MTVSGYKIKKSGFTFIEVSMGIAVLLMGLIFYTTMVKYYSYARNDALVNTNFGIISQNLTKNYENNNDINASLLDINSDYPDFDTTMTVVPQPGTMINLVTITITPKNTRITPYKLLYYSSDKSIMR